MLMLAALIPSEDPFGGYKSTIFFKKKSMYILSPNFPEWPRMSSQMWPCVWASEVWSEATARLVQTAHWFAANKCFCWKVKFLLRHITLLMSSFQSLYSSLADHIRNPETLRSFRSQSSKHFSWSTSLDARLNGEHSIISCLQFLWTLSDLMPFPSTLHPHLWLWEQKCFAELLKKQYSSEEYLPFQFKDL